MAQKCIEKHEIHVFDRGGMNPLGILHDVASVKWERGRDRKTSATIKLIGDACWKQKTLLESLRSHRHEVVIYRGSSRVWEGPINRITARSSSYEIYATDILEYIFATPLTQDYSNAYPNTTEVTTRIGDIIQYELTHGRTQRVSGSGPDQYVPAWEELDPPANIVQYVQVHHFPNEARTSSSTTAYQTTVGGHLQDLARRSGIDFTVVGRSLHIWDVSRSLGELSQMTESNFLSEVIVSEYGSDHTQSAYVATDGAGTGSALNPDNLEYYGPWTSVYTVYNEEQSQDPTQSELNSQAARNLSGRSPAPIEVRVPDNSGIEIKGEVTIDRLIPGVRVPLRATLNARTLSQVQKIDSVTVTEDKSGENVAITLTPATSSDSDETGEQE